MRKLKDQRILEGMLATSTSNGWWQTYGGKSWCSRHGRVIAEEKQWLIPPGLKLHEGSPALGKEPISRENERSPCRRRSI